MREGPMRQAAVGQEAMRGKQRSCLGRNCPVQRQGDCGVKDRIWLVRV